MELSLSHQIVAVLVDTLYVGPKYLHNAITGSNSCHKLFTDDDLERTPSAASQTLLSLESDRGMLEKVP